MCVCDGVCVHTLIYIPGGEPSTLSCICTICVKLMSLYSHCMMWERTYVCVSVSVCVFVVEGTEGGMGGSVSQVHAGAKQSHQLLLIVGDVPLHDLLTGAQEALKCLDVYY